jgi:hypothetical protein
VCCSGDPIYTLEGADAMSGIYLPLLSTADPTGLERSPIAMTFSSSHFAAFVAVDLEFKAKPQPQSESKQQQLQGSNDPVAAIAVAAATDNKKDDTDNDSAKNAPNASSAPTPTPTPSTSTANNATTVPDNKNEGSVATPALVQPSDSAAASVSTGAIAASKSEATIKTGESKNEQNDDKSVSPHEAYLPLTDSTGHMLHVHFLLEEDLEEFKRFAVGMQQHAFLPLLCIVADPPLFMPFHSGSICILPSYSSCYSIS